MPYHNKGLKMRTYQGAVFYVGVLGFSALTRETGGQVPVSDKMGYVISS